MGLINILRYHSLKLLVSKGPVVVAIGTSVFSGVVVAQV